MTYLLFAFDSYYPQGGAEDIYGCNGAAESDENALVWALGLVRQSKDEPLPPQHWQLIAVEEQAWRMVWTSDNGLFT